jgi:hypothetical protein
VQLLALLRALVGTLAAVAVPQTLTAHAVRRDLSELPQATVSRGALRVTHAPGFDTGGAYEARYCGGPGNGYARGVVGVHWPAGATRSYGMALLLPAALARHQQGEIDLLRWDNFPLYGDRGDYGGVVLFHGDGRARLQRGHYDGGVEPLGGSFALPRGRWFWLEVRQRLSDGPDARSTVLVDGRVVASSPAPNAYGREVRRVRFGIVAVDDTTQRRSLRLLFDRATVGAGRLGPPTAAERRRVVVRRSTRRPQEVPATCSR